MNIDPKEIESELQKVVSNQAKELSNKLDNLSQKSLKRVIKALTGVINDDTKLSDSEQQFIDRVFQAQENYLALNGLKNEQLSQKED